MRAGSVVTDHAERRQRRLLSPLGDTPVQRVNAGMAVMADDIVLASARNGMIADNHHCLAQERIVQVPITDMEPRWQFIDRDERDNILPGSIEIEFGIRLLWGGFFLLWNLH